MQTKPQINRAVFGHRRPRRNARAVGQLARAPKNLVTARLRRLAVVSARNRTGLTALFTGPSGTGKTIAAALARSLGKKLQIVDLSAGAENYIGETEKNLSRLLANARRSNAVLFFDEADALFGKRTEVKDSHDRYANQEVSYLLARIEAYRGLVILRANARTALDPALMRRIRMVIDLPPARG